MTSEIVPKPKLLAELERHHAVRTPKIVKVVNGGFVQGVLLWPSTERTQRNIGEQKVREEEREKKKKTEEGERKKRRRNGREEIINRAKRKKRQKLKHSMKKYKKNIRWKKEEVHRLGKDSFLVILSLIMNKEPFF